MIACTNCGTSNLDSSHYCDECGAKLIKFDAAAPAYVPPNRATISVSRDIPQVEPLSKPNGANSGGTRAMNAKLVIERGGVEGAEFRLSGTEAIIGRWDADNGVFPDVDLDTHDQEAKVSRRHARIRLVDGRYTVEDLGSTNGTYINRGKRLLPGMSQPIADGDELIVGKTFLRFHVNAA
jgi:pSer/pThr/pTyr-binding forkhead associated (FHA) protein